MKHLIAAILLLTGLGAQAAVPVTPAAPAVETLSHGRFEGVKLYRPVGDARSVVLLLSGETGWDAGMHELASALVREGALVAGIGTPQFFAELQRDGDDCEFPGGDLENLSHYLQGYARLRGYYPPFLVGTGNGAAFAYAMLAQVPRDTFAGAISIGFNPQLSLRKPLCAGEAVRYAPAKPGLAPLLPAAKLANPWIVLLDTAASDAAGRFVAQVAGAQRVTLQPRALKTQRDWQPVFLDQYRTLQARAGVRVAAPPANLGELPIIEVPAQGSSPLFAVLLSGDGGWAGLDKSIAGALAAKGIPVAGWDSLRYFWTPRTPQGLAADLDRVLRYYAAQWKKSRALLIGYSQGADVLPFAVNRLPATSTGLVGQTVLLGLGQRAAFEFHVTNWVGSDDSGLPILPEARKLDGRRTLCLYGEDEEDSLCPVAGAAHLRALALPGGHHFDGDYDRLATLILQHANDR